MMEDNLKHRVSYISYFPMLIKYTALAIYEKFGCCVVNDPKDIKNGEPFKVLVVATDFRFDIYSNASTTVEMTVTHISTGLSVKGSGINEHKLRTELRDKLFEILSYKIE